MDAADIPANIVTALGYLQARYYDPSTGQFISRDPLTALTRHPYAYTKVRALDLVEIAALSTRISILLATDEANRCLLRTGGAYWTAGQLAELAAALGVPFRTSPEPLSIEELARRIPGGVPPLLIRPEATRAVLGMGMIVAIVGAILLFDR